MHFNAYLTCLCFRPHCLLIRSFSQSSVHCKKAKPLASCLELLEYVGKLFNTLINTQREELQALADELKENVPQPLHTMLPEKENPEAAKAKYLLRKQKVTEICPPTCTGK